MNPHAKKNRPLTLRQRETYDFILSYVRDNGFAPSSVDIRKHFGFKSSRAALDLLDALERKEFIYRAPGVARGMRILNKEHVA